MSDPSQTFEQTGLSAHGYPLETRLVGARDLAERHKDDWDALVEGRVETAPFMDTHWLHSYREARPTHDLTAAATYRGKRLVGIAPLALYRESERNLGLRVAHSTSFDWLSRYEFIADEQSIEILSALWQAWLKRGDIDLIHLELMADASPTLAQGLVQLRAHGWHAFVERTFSSPWKALPLDPVAWSSGLKSKFKANLRNRERRLTQLGELQFEVVRDSGSLPAALDVFYQIEASGWKAGTGTAIKLQPEVRTFYDYLVTHAPGDIWIGILRINRSPIAAQLIRTCGGILYLLKIGFDPAYRAYSPGQLITARMMEYAIGQGVQQFDFLGADMTWKSDWQPSLRPNYVMRAFAPTVRGRLAYWSRYGVKEKIKRLPGATALAQKIRGTSDE